MKTKILSALLLGLTLTVAFALTAGARQSTSAAIEQLALLYFEEFPSDNNVIEADALFARMKEGAKMLILDVRPQDAYRKSHLKGAINLSFFDMSIPNALEKLPERPSWSIARPARPPRKWWFC